MKLPEAVARLIALGELVYHSKPGDVLPSKVRADLDEILNEIKEEYPDGVPAAFADLAQTFHLLEVESAKPDRNAGAVDHLYRLIGEHGSLINLAEENRTARNLKLGEGEAITRASFDALSPESKSEIVKAGHR